MVTQTPNVTNQTTSIFTGTTFTVTPGGADVPVGTTYTWTAPTYAGEVTGGSAQTTPQPNIFGTLTIPTGAGTANYTVTPSYGGCTGIPFTVTVIVTSSCIPVTIDTQPADKNMCAISGNASFTVVATGTSPTYQWQYFNGSTWANVTNGIPAGASYTYATTATLGVTGIITAGNHQYRCYITNCSSGINATSNAAVLTVNAKPTAPISGTITQPNCAVATGSVVLSSLPAGTWTINPGSITGSTASRTISGLATGTYTYTVTNSVGCTSSASVNVVINAQPATPTAPTVGTITQPTCAVATGSVVLSGLPSGNWTINPGGITGSTTSKTISGLAAGTYNYTVTNSVGCTSLGSGNVIVNVQPITPTVTITNPAAVCSPLKVDLTAPAVTAGSTTGLDYTYWTNAAATIAYATPAAAVAGTYYIKGTTAAGCC